MSKRWRIGVGVVCALGCLGGAFHFVYGGGELESAGTVNPKRPPPESVQSRREAERVTGERSQILFGDLHVHTTFSADAFMRSLPLLGGEGAHPPADACDFARFCSQLDFFAITDHAEGLTPRQWAETKESVRQCNAVAGDPANPDVVAYTGWEWSQVGTTPKEHYGHKNVIFRETAEAALPARPIGAGGTVAAAMRNAARMGGGSELDRLLVPVRDFARRQRYLDLQEFQRESARVGDCPAGVNSKELPRDCRELAATPRELFDKLDHWGFDALVIPHGTTWGFYTPPGYTWDKQLDPSQNDPKRQNLFEIYSGHGNSEEYRSWQEVNGAFDEPGATCPAPTPDHEPCCWRAGEIIRGRCADAPAAECERRVEKARLDYVRAGVAGHLTVPGAGVEDWKDCGQCRDCFNPAFSYRPGASAQYALAKGANFGFIASSDNHSARPGTGYKEFGRRKMGEATGPESESWRQRFFPKQKPPLPESESLGAEDLMKLAPFQLVHLERQASFFMTGGLVAVHSQGRSREAIWDALRRREVYGTSGERILLWFDLENGPSGRVAMGSEVKLGTAPKLRVRAAGAFAQKPGCPDWVHERLGARDVERLCLGECFNAGDQRRRITRVEVVRIRPLRGADAELATAIDDPWKRVSCDAGREICEIELEDPEFVEGKRDVIYYVRAIQEPTPAVNAGGLRCERDAAGNCVQARPCYGDYRTKFEDDCLSENEERAWSSPIYVRWQEVTP
ncbi:MAG: DUF3604 domain-containing protein [Polyangiaceae bacterium]|nr:DUF3604 domain-containing protein [Polyangiaceae bacterium]MCL4749991.1 DUF3604 domain-containing protein [Myxococcales bacterium]